MHKPLLFLAAIGILGVGGIASLFRYQTIPITGTGAIVVTDRLTGKSQYCLGVQGCAPMGQKLPGVLAQEEAKTKAEALLGANTPCRPPKPVTYPPGFEGRKSENNQTIADVIAELDAAPLQCNPALKDKAP